MHMFKADQVMENVVRSVQDAYQNAGFSPVGSLRDLDHVIPAPGGKLCLGMECLDRDLWDYERAAEQIGMIGIRRARLQSGWQKTEQTPGVYDFSWLDAIVDSLLANGVKPFLSLSYGNRLYCSNPEEMPDLKNGGLGHFPIITPQERTAWCAYVKAAVEHFRDRIDEYEIWNEPDVLVFCRVPMKWPDAYMELVRMTAPVIREAMPEATVITCTAGFENIQPLYERGLMDYCDVHSFHGYLFFPEMRSVDYYANFLAPIRRRYPSVRFWRGEAGCPSYNNPISKGALSNIPVTEIKQAKFAMRHLLMDLKNDCISCTSYFHAYDFEHFTHKLRYHYGVIRHEDLSRKPAYHCLQVFSRLFDGDTVRRTQDNLTYGFREEGTLAQEQRPAVQFSAFERKGIPFYTYHLPLYITDDFCVKTLPLSVPQGIRTPVVADPVSREVFVPQDGLYPIADYPLILMDAQAAEEFAALSVLQNDSRQDDLNQRYEE